MYIGTAECPIAPSSPPSRQVCMLPFAHGAKGFPSTASHGPAKAEVENKMSEKLKPKIIRRYGLDSPRKRLRSPAQRFPGCDGEEPLANGMESSSGILVTSTKAATVVEAVKEIAPVVT